MKPASTSAGLRVNLTLKMLFSARHAFTRLELLVVTVVMTTVVGLLLPALTNAKAKAKRICCVGQLKNIGLSHRIFATDNNGLFPWEKQRAPVTNQFNFPDLSKLTAGEQVVRIFQSLSNELSTPKIIVCPSDIRKEASNWQQLTINNISYFLGTSAEESFPQSFLSGDRNLTINGQRITGRVDVTEKSLAAWDKTMHKNQGTAAMGDGSVQQLSSLRLREQLRNTGVATNTFIFP
jgi:type II secretory pathway pseudopilin PulG